MPVPSVSVLMPVYNAEKYLSEAIDSILSQTFVNFEFVIIDDGSTDLSWRILQQCAEKDARIKLFRNETNRGLVFTLNRGLELCSGTYIARMDADDISLPHRLDVQVNYLEKNATVGIVGSAFFKMTGHYLKCVKVPVMQHDIMTCLMFRNCISHPTIMIRNELIKKYKLYYPNVVWAEDYAFFVKCLPLFDIGNIDKALLKYRLHAEQVCFQQTVIQQENALKIKLECVEHNLQRKLSVQERIVHTNLTASKALTYSEMEEVVEWCAVLYQFNKQAYNVVHSQFVECFRKSARVHGIALWPLYFQFRNAAKFLSVAEILFFIKLYAANCKYRVMSYFKGAC